MRHISGASWEGIMESTGSWEWCDGVSGVVERFLVYVFEGWCGRMTGDERV